MKSCITCLCMLFASVVAAEPFVPSEKRPDDAVILYDGQGVCQFVDKNGASAEENWKIQDGCLISTSNKSRTNHILSVPRFQDADIHVEFKTDPKGEGNSGIYIHGLYEMQIFNSENKSTPSFHDCGALYGKKAPLVNACKGPGVWQTYDIRFISPRRDKDGKVIQEGRITAWLNGQKVQEDTAFGEPWSVYHPYRYRSSDYLQKVYKELLETGKGPLFLQDHDSPCQYRNVWIKEIK